MATVTTEYRVTFYNENEEWKDQLDFDKLADALEAAKDIPVGESAEVDRIRTNRVADVSKAMPTAKVEYV